MEEGSTSGNDKLEGKREEEDAWSDLHALKRLYGLLQQSTSVADRVEPQESIEKLDQKSTILLKKLLDDATQQAVQSQAKFLFNPSATINEGVKPTEPPIVVTTPGERVAEEFQHFHDRPNQTKPVLHMNSVGLNPPSTSQIKSSIAGSEFGKETPVGRDSINMLTKKEPIEEQILRERDHRKPNDLSFVKEIDHKLVNKQFQSPSKMARQRSTAMSSIVGFTGSNRIVVSGNHYKRTRVEPKPRTPLKLDKVMAVDVSSSRPERKSPAEKDREVNKGVKSIPLDSKPTVPIITSWDKDARGSEAQKKTAQNRKSTARIEPGAEKRPVDLTLKRRPKDQTFRTIRRPTIEPKHRRRGRSSTVNSNRKRAVRKKPNQLTVTRRIIPQRLSATSSSKSSCSRSSCSSSSSPSIVSNGIRGPNVNRRIPDRRVVIHHPRSERRASPITTQRSFGSRRSPTRLASLPKQSKLLTSNEQNNGNINGKKTKKEGKLRRIKNKLSVIFHHHHHHYHHGNNNNRGKEKEGYPQDKQHRSLWKYIRGKKDEHYNSKGKDVEIYAEKAVVRDSRQNQHGYFHMLLDGLIRHLWHTRERRERKKQKQKQKQKQKRLVRGSSVGGRLKVKKLHWWQKWKKSGGVKLNARKKKPLLKLGLGRKSGSTKKR